MLGQAKGKSVIKPNTKVAAPKPLNLPSMKSEHSVTADGAAPAARLLLGLMERGAVLIAPQRLLLLAMTRARDHRAPIRAKLGVRPTDRRQEERVGCATQVAYRCEVCQVRAGRRSQSTPHRMMEHGGEPAAQQQQPQQPAAEIKPSSKPLSAGLSLSGDAWADVVEEDEGWLEDAPRATGSSSMRSLLQSNTLHRRLLLRMFAADIVFSSFKCVFLPYVRADSLC